MDANQAVLTEYINELKDIVSEMSGNTALAKAKNKIQAKISSETISQQEQLINELNARVSSLQSEKETQKEETSSGFTYGDEGQKVSDFTLAEEDQEVVTEETTKLKVVTEETEQPEDQEVVTEEPEKTQPSVEVDLFRRVKELERSSEEQEDYISRLEAGIQEGNKIIADAESSRDKALERLRELEESQQEALKKANTLEKSKTEALKRARTLESSQQEALKKAKELEEKLKRRPAETSSNVVSMKNVKTEERMMKMEQTNLKLLKDLTAAENKIQQLKEKALKDKK